MGHGDCCYEYEEIERRDNRYYPEGNGIYSHPETAGDFRFEDERYNR